MVEETAFLALLAVIYATIATFCMMWPERLHTYALRRNDAARGRNSFAVWLVESPNYVLYVQLLGAISASAAVAITLFLLERVRNGS
jgi:hypothetical protein